MIQLFFFLPSLSKRKSIEEVNNTRESTVGTSVAVSGIHKVSAMSYGHVGDNYATTAEV